jgi:nitroreductase
MDAIEALLTRKMVRGFTQQPVTDDQIDTLLKVMVAAPSGGNRQPWRIIVVQDPKVKEALTAGAFGQQFIAQAPVVFVVLRVPGESEARYGGRGRDLYSFQDTAAMVENLLVAAHAMGLAACWVGAFTDDAIARAVKCPAGAFPAAVIPLGYPSKTSTKPARRPMDEVVQFIPPRKAKR